MYPRRPRRIRNRASLEDLEVDAYPPFHASQPRIQMTAQVRERANQYQESLRPKIDIEDHSEFPSLSGAPQAQQSSASSQAIWSSTGLRGPQTSTTRSSNTPSSTSQVIRPPSGLSSQTRQSDPQDDASLGPFPSLGAAADDYPFGQSPASMMARQHQQQQGATDEFPPLGGLGGAGLGQQRSRLGQESMTNDTLASNQLHARLPQETPSQRINDRKDSPPSQGSRGQFCL